MLKFTIGFILCLHIGATVQQNAPQCGVPPVSKATNSVEWPWYVAIVDQSKPAPKLKCGGTLISDRFVLTAAHCVVRGRNLAPNKISTRMGLHGLDEINSESVQKHGVAKIYTPGNYSSYSENDIALLELSSAVQFNENVQPICLNQVADLTGEYGTIVGWGLSDDNGKMLSKVRMPAIGLVECLTSNRDLFGQTLNEGVFCAGYSIGTDICNGYGGSGLVFEQSNVWYVGGILSFAQKSFGYDEKCSVDGYAGFTKVQHYLPWIEQITAIKN